MSIYCYIDRHGLQGRREVGQTQADPGRTAKAAPWAMSGTRGMAEPVAFSGRPGKEARKSMGLFLGGEGVYSRPLCS